MAKLDLTELGITAEELRQRVVDKIAGDLMSDECFEADLERKVSKMLKEKVDAAVEDLGDKVVGPRVAEMIEDLCLRETNRFGEQVGKTLTFTEYLVARAEAYMTEPVNFQGNTKAQDSYSWKPNTTRVAYMMDEYLQYNIKTAMEKAFQSANSRIAEGITAAVKLSLTQVLGGISATVKVK